MATLFGKHRIAIKMTDLSISDIALLTRILSRPPAAWSSPPSGASSKSLPALINRRLLPATLIGETQLIKALPRHLLAPIPWQSKVVCLFPARASIPGSSPLCDHHKPLNAQLIHSLFTALKQEVGPHFIKLRSRIHDSLSAEHLHLIRSLHSVQALWVPPSEFGTTFTDETPLWRYQGDRCEACILASVGGDVAMVTNLRTVILARCRRDRDRDPRFLAWVDGWTDLFIVPGEKGDIRIKSDQAAELLRRLRKGARSRQKQRSRKAESARPYKVDFARQTASKEADFSAWSQTQADSSRHAPSSHRGTLRQLELSESPFANEDPFIGDDESDEESNYSDVEDDIINSYAGFQSKSDLPRSTSVHRGRYSLCSAPTPALTSGSSLPDGSVCTGTTPGPSPLADRFSKDSASSHAEEYQKLFTSPFAELKEEHTYPGDTRRETTWGTLSESRKGPLGASISPMHNDPSMNTGVSDGSTCRDCHAYQSEVDRSSRWSDASRWSEIPPETPKLPNPEKSRSKSTRAARTTTIWGALYDETE